MSILKRIYKDATERLARIQHEIDLAKSQTPSVAVNAVTIASPLAKLYINTLKSSLLNELYIENEVRIVQAMRHLFYKTEATFENIYKVDPALRFVIHDYKHDGRSTGMHRKEADGSYTPVYELRNYLELAHTMIGRKRLDNIQYCI